MSDIANGPKGDSAPSDRVPPSLQFFHIDNGEALLNTEGLSDEERVAAKFCTWIRGRLDEAGPDQAQRPNALNMHTSNEAATFVRKSDRSNLLLPSSIEVSLFDDGPGEMELYEVKFRSYLGEPTDTEFSVALMYDEMPGVDTEDPEFVVREVDLSFNDASPGHFDSDQRSEFVAGFEAAYESLKTMVEQDYEPAPQQD